MLRAHGKKKRMLVQGVPFVCVATDCTSVTDRFRSSGPDIPVAAAPR